MRFLKLFDTFWRCQQTHKLDMFSAGLFDALYGGDRRIAGSEHGVDDNDWPLREFFGNFKVVLHCHQRVRIAVQPHMSYPSRRNQVEHTFE